MSDAHRKAFVAESEEGITELNNALLALESDPDDAEAMDSIFRIAHTLKGNGAAMGYDAVSGLAHELEDLLDEVRAGEIEIDTELMDLLFDGVDYLDAMIDEIATEGETTIDATEIEADLRTLIERGGGTEADGDDVPATESTTTSATEPAVTTEAQSTETAETPSEPAASETLLPDAFAEATLASGEAVYRATVTLAETTMQGVDAIFVLQAVDNAYSLVVTDPDREAVEDGEFEDDFDLFVIDSAAEAVTKGLEALSKVESVVVSPVTATAQSELTAGAVGNPESDAVSPPAGSPVLESSDKTSNDATSAEAPDTTASATAVDTDSVGDGDSASADATDSASADDDSKSSTAGRSKPSRSKKDGTNIASVRVDVDQLDALYSLVEQLVTSRIKLRREMESAGLDSDNLDELDKITANLQNTAMDMRLIPLSKVVDTFPRLVRDVARETGKDVDFTVSGADIELDRTILTEIRDPLIHILRNAVDHGVEPPEKRDELGKSPTGQVSLTATRERDHVTIEVADDGAGLDKDVLKAKALEKGIKTETELDLMEDQEIYELIFHPGFSTAEEVTDVSGRGVGMDVVHNTVKQLDGTVSVDSELGEGSVVRLRLPVTVAIVKVMFVEIGGTEYGIPVKNIAEVTRATNIHTTNGDEIIKHDNDIYRVLRLSELLDEPSSVNGDGMLLRIRDEKRQVALHCDRVLDQEEVVVKPLEGVLSGIPGLSGTAVLGDGDVVAVLDVVTL